MSAPTTCLGCGEWFTDDELVGRVCAECLAGASEAVSVEPPRCPYCGRVMSRREHAEQGACNDCHVGGAR